MSLVLNAYLMTYSYHLCRDFILRGSNLSTATRQSPSNGSTNRLLYQYSSTRRLLTHHPIETLRLYVYGPAGVGLCLANLIRSHRPMERTIDRITFPWIDFLYRNEGSARGWYKFVPPVWAQPT
jgi:hypothetical protein